MHRSSPGQRGCVPTVPTVQGSRDPLCPLAPPAQPWAPRDHLALALARPLRRCQGHTSPVPQDLGSADLKRERLFLVCQIIRVGRMDLRDSHSRKLSTGLRRPFGISGGGGLHGDPQGLPCHHPGTPQPPHQAPTVPFPYLPTLSPFRAVPAHGTQHPPCPGTGDPQHSTAEGSPEQPWGHPCLHLPPRSCSGRGSLTGGATPAMVPPVCHCSDGHH